MKSISFGIRDITLPLRLKQRSGGEQHSVASIVVQARTSSRPASSFPEILATELNSFSGEFSINTFSALLDRISDKIGASYVNLDVSFPYFIEKSAPVTGTKSIMEYTCGYSGWKDGQRSQNMLSVAVPVTTLCPCSKEISEAGAHNQRAEVSLQIKYSSFIWIEELIELIEKSASCELYALLKRPDEKYVTEKAYNNPMFVEDVVRKVAENASSNKNISWFSVSAESFESIHKHSAYALVNSNELSG